MARHAVRKGSFVGVTWLMLGSVAALSWGQEPPAADADAKPAASAPEKPASPAADSPTAVTPANPGKPAADLPLPTVPVPAAFSKDAPADLDDLRAMETHVRMLVQKLRGCTVSVQIGRSQGSGVIVTKEGHVLTAAHVIGRPGRRCTLILSDGTRLNGTTLGSNRTLDAGLIRINEEELKDRTLPHAEMAPLSSIDPGDWCLALGHPGGFNRRRGSVIRMGRVIYVNPRVLQTDCELVGGDSGGPLFDMLGQVVGINSRIQESTNANFHVPASAYVDDWDRLVAGEFFETHSGAFLGVSGEPSEEGLRITRVWDGGSAAAAGVKVGDVITAFESRKIDTIETLQDLVGRVPPGESVRIELLREGRSMRLTVELRMRRDDKPQP